MALLPYLGTLRNAFVWDDLQHIAHNPHIASVSDAAVYLHRLEGTYFRPLVFFSYSLERFVWGLAPSGFHLTNLLLHALVTVLVVVVAIRSGTASRAALVAGAVFALHPAQTEAVAYISGRTDLLMTAAALLAWWAVLGSGGALWRGLLAGTAAGVAILSKESGFAVVLFLAWLAYRKETEWRPRFALAGPAVASAALLLAARPGGVPWPTAPFHFAIWIIGVARTIETYVSLLVWPSTLMVDRLTPLSASTLAAAAALAIVAGAVVASAWGLSKRGSIGDWTAWTLAFYLPVANLLPLYPAIAQRAVFTPEHNLYAPIAGLAALSGIAIDRLLNQLPRYGRLALAASGSLVLAVWGIQTASRTLQWRDEAMLFRSAAVAGSISPRVWYNLGNVLMQRGDAGSAVIALRRASELAPSDAEVWTNLAVALQSRGLLDAAQQAYQRAEELSPANALLLENMGTLYLARGDLEAARRAFARSLALDPQRAKSRAAIQAIDQRSGDPPP